MSRPPSRAAATTARNALKTWAADQAAYEAENSTARPHQSPHSRSAKSNTVPIAKSNTVPFAISNTVSEARRFQLALDSETDVVKSGVRKGMLKGKAIRRVLRNAGLSEYAFKGATQYFDFKLGDVAVVTGEATRTESSVASSDFSSGQGCGLFLNIEALDASIGVMQQIADGKSVDGGSVGDQSMDGESVDSLFAATFTEQQQRAMTDFISARGAPTKKKFFFLLLAEMGFECIARAASEGAPIETDEDDEVPSIAAAAPSGPGAQPQAVAQAQTDLQGDAQRFQMTLAAEEGDVLLKGERAGKMKREAIFRTLKAVGLSANGYVGAHTFFHFDDLEVGTLSGSGGSIVLNIAALDASIAVMRRIAEANSSVHALFSASVLAYLVNEPEPQQRAMHDFLVGHREVFRKKQFFLLVLMEMGFRSIINDQPS